MLFSEYVPLTPKAAKKSVAVNSFMCKTRKLFTVHGAVWVLCTSTKIGLLAHQALRMNLQLDSKYTGAAATIREGIVAQTIVVAMHAEIEKEQ